MGLNPTRRMLYFKWTVPACNVINPWVQTHYSRYETQHIAYYCVNQYNNIKHFTEIENIYQTHLYSEMKDCVKNISTVINFR